MKCSQINLTCQPSCWAGWSLKRLPGTGIAPYSVVQCGIGPMLLPTSGGGMSGVTKRTALCLKIDIGGVVQYH
jgi:hypothetical protein